MTVVVQDHTKPVANESAATMATRRGADRFSATKPAPKKSATTISVCRIKTPEVAVVGP